MTLSFLFLDGVDVILIEVTFTFKAEKIVFDQFTLFI